MGLESGGIPEFQRNPQEWTGILAESAGMDWNSSGICKSGLESAESAGMDQNLQECSLEFALFF